MTPVGGSRRCIVAMRAQIALASGSASAPGEARMVGQVSTVGLSGDTQLYCTVFCALRDLTPSSWSVR